MAGTRKWRRAIVVGVALCLVAPAVPAAAAPDRAVVTGSKVADSKVAPAVRANLAADDKATFWVALASRADLTGARAKSTKLARVTEVYRVKTEHARRTQAGLRTLLESARAEYTPYWISNTIKVTGDAKLLAVLAERPEVARIHADVPIPLPKPVATGLEANARVDGVEWNIDRVGAPRVWDELGVRGEDIVVANIDSGVDWTHPALTARYRGRGPDGVISHDYNWFDPSRVCPSPAPCDNNDHGTHTMGTMVGDDGTNRIGVAPGAKWIAAKGCETNDCSEAALLATGQWILAPTDLAGANPRPDLAPDVVNNSWGGGTIQDAWYNDIVTSWVAAGIFPSFSNGNAGPGCRTTGSPGSYVASYSTGATDATNTITSFSSRGAGENGEIKPNITAPGDEVRSAVPGGFDVFSGTSMAAPHTSATVALLWSASPVLRGDVAATRALLDRTAVDVNDLTCGGTAADNLTYGEGRLDAYAAVAAAPQGPIGALTGTVTSGGEPVVGATVTITGPLERTTTTGDDGTFAFPRLVAGEYTVRATKFGHQPASATASITEGGSATVSLSLDRAPSATLSGTVTLGGEPVADAALTLVGTPLSATSDARGRYSIVAPTGEYDLRTVPVDRCADAVTTHLVLTADTTQDVVLPARTDAFGYACGATSTPYPVLTAKLDLTGDDALKAVELPFTIPFYGAAYRTATITTNGTIAFGTASTTGVNGTIPSTGNPNGAIYAFWDDLKVDDSAGIYTGVVGEAGQRMFAVEWRNVVHYSDASQRLSIVALIGGDGSIVLRYKDVAGIGLETGSSATIGLENATGTVAYSYSHNTSGVVRDGFALAFRTIKHGVVRGVVTDGNDGAAIAGATVTVSSGDAVVATTTTGADGSYLAQVPVGALTVNVSAPHYETRATPVTITAGGVQVADAALRTARVVADPAGLEIVAVAGGSRTRTIALANTGALDTGYTISEAIGDVPGDVPWLSTLGGPGTLPAGGTASVLVTVSTVGLQPGTHHTATVRITSASGRVPVLSVPVHLVVPGFQAALDAGSRRSHVDSMGDTWQPDAAHQAGGCGYLGSSSEITTRKPIAGTTDQTRLADARQGMYEYRCDALANGVYTVELDFAELKNLKPNRRVFDVLIEGVEVLPSMDIALEAGAFTATGRTFSVKVVDGQLNVRFITHQGFSKPLVSAVRMTHRPDRTS